MQASTTDKMPASTAIAEEIKNIRKKAKKSEGRAVSWTEEDYLENRGKVNTGVIILSTKGCSWARGEKGGCAMCGYVYSGSNKSDEELMGDFKQGLKKLEKIEYLKLFNSGSFFDGSEVSKKLLEDIIKEVNKLSVSRFQVESRPEFITEERVKALLNILDPKIELEIGIGLETSNDYIRKNCINKGFAFSDFKRAAKICRENKALVKAYLLFKPPFVSEREAINDCIASAIDAAEAGASRISINPMNIQNGTLVEVLWKRGEYDLPWLWSIIYAMKEIKSKISIPVLCHPSGAGTRRGANNRFCCDEEAIKAIKEFSLTQNIEILSRSLENATCPCIKNWEDFLYC